MPPRSPRELLSGRFDRNALIGPSLDRSGILLHESKQLAGRLDSLRLDKRGKLLAAFLKAQPGETLNFRRGASESRLRIANPGSPETGSLLIAVDALKAHERTTQTKTDELRGLDVLPVDAKAKR
jgi:hypothetical protein